MSIETTMTVTVTPDPDYRFDVYVAEDELYVEYVQAFKSVNGMETRKSIGFGSRDEMEAVALAMLQALKATA